MLWIFVSPYPQTYLILITNLSSVYAAYLSLCTYLYPPPPPHPRSPKCGATVHLEGAPTCWPTPCVCDSLPCRTSQGVPHWACDWLPLSCFPPFAILDLHPGLCLSQVFTYPRVLSSLCLPPSSTRPFSTLQVLTSSPVPCRSQVVVIVFFCPSPLMNPPRPSFVPPCPLVSYVVWFHFLGVIFCDRVRGLGASTHWKSLAQALAHALISHTIIVHSTPLPPPVPSLSFPPKSLWYHNGIGEDIGAWLWKSVIRAHVSAMVEADRLAKPRAGWSKVNFFCRKGIPPPV